MSYAAAISVIIPAFNSAHFITSSLRSAQAQTIPPLEIIVIDDGSSDNTAQVVEEYISQQVTAHFADGVVPVRLLRQKNGGPAAARNHGAREAKGEWLAFLDADDTFLPQKLEKQLPHTNDPQVGVVHGREVPPSKPITFETLWQRNQITNSTTLVRKAAFEQAEGFDEDPALIGVEDYNLWLRLAQQNWTFVTCPEKLINYTRVEGSLSLQVERFAQAELKNLQKLAHTLNLPRNLVEQKRLAIFDEYGQMLVHTRRLSAARRFLAVPLRRQPTLTRLIWFVTAFVPASILDMRIKTHSSHVRAKPEKSAAVEVTCKDKESW